MTDEENAKFNRMCMAVLAADEMVTTLTRERDEARLALSECREVATRNATDAQHLRASAVELERERDALKEELARAKAEVQELRETVLELLP